MRRCSPTFSEHIPCLILHLTVLSLVGATLAVKLPWPPYMGHKVLLISGNLDRLGYLSCNPAIGGLAKGHGAEIGALTYRSTPALVGAAGIQFRVLNMSKGPAVRPPPRAQIDQGPIGASPKLLYAPGMRIWQVRHKVTTDDGRVTGVRTARS